MPAKETVWKPIRESLHLHSESDISPYLMESFEYSQPHSEVSFFLDSQRDFPFFYHLLEGVLEEDVAQAIDDGLKVKLPNRKL